MNFKPNPLKILISILAGGILGYVLAWQQTISSGWMFHMNVFIVLSLVFIITFYIIWSLVQSKIKSKKKKR